MGKEFKTSMAFINTENEEEQPQQEEPKQKPRKTTEGKKQRDLTQAEGKQEDEDKPKRTRRVQAVFTPELYEQLNDYAWTNRKSVNGTIIEAVEEYLRRHK